MNSTKYSTTQILFALRTLVGRFGITSCDGKTYEDFEILPSDSIDIISADESSGMVSIEYWQSWQEDEEVRDSRKCLTIPEANEIDNVIGFGEVNGIL